MITCFTFYIQVSNLKYRKFNITCLLRLLLCRPDSFFVGTLVNFFEVEE